MIVCRLGCHDTGGSDETTHGERQTGSSKVLFNRCKEMEHLKSALIPFEGVCCGVINV